MATYLLPRPMRSIRRPTEAIDPMTPSVGSRISLVNDFRLSTTIMSPECTGTVKSVLLEFSRSSRNTCCCPEEVNRMTRTRLRAPYCIGTAGTRQRFADGRLGPGGEDHRPGHLTRDGDPHERLHHELGVLLEPAQEAPDVGLGRGERHPGDPDRPVERMADRAVRGDQEVTAELGLAPDLDTYGVARREDCLFPSRRGPPAPGSVGRAPAMSPESPGRPGVA